MKLGNRQQEAGNSKIPGVFGFVFCALLYALLSPANAQQANKLSRIGYLAADSRAPTREAFRQGLVELGYVEGKNIVIEWRFTEGKPDRFPELASQLVRLDVDVIVAGNSGVVSMLHGATKTIPIVMATYGGDPVADGIVTSFAKPGGNITGVTSLSPELGGKQVELLKETLPKLSRLSVIWNPDESVTRVQRQEVQTVAASRGIQTLFGEVRIATDLYKAIEFATLNEPTRF